MRWVREGGSEMGEGSNKMHSKHEIMRGRWRWCEGGEVMEW